MTMGKAALIEKYPEIGESPMTMEVPLLWGDMDSAKHVNNLVYLKWAETSRILVFDKMMDTSFEGKEGPILGWQDCKYIFPMTFPDTALITCNVTEIREDRFMMISKIFSLNHCRIAAISKQSIVPYDYKNLKKIAIPAAWMPKLEALSMPTDSQ